MEQEIIDIESQIQALQAKKEFLQSKNQLLRETFELAKISNEFVDKVHSYQKKFKKQVKNDFDLIEFVGLVIDTHQMLSKEVS